MSVAFTSRLSLAVLGQRFGQQAAAVYLFIAEFRPDPAGAGPSIADIGDALKLQYSTVSARVHALKKANVISEAPLKLNPSGVKAKTYRANTYRPVAPALRPDAQPDLFAEVIHPGINPRRPSFV